VRIEVDSRSMTQPMHAMTAKQVEAKAGISRMNRLGEMVLTHMTKKVHIHGQKPRANGIRRKIVQNMT